MATLEWIVSHVSAVAELTTVFQPAWLDALVASLSAAVGFPADQVKYLLGIFLAYPLALVDSRISSPNVRHLFSLGWGVFLAQFVLGSGWIHAFISSTMVYAILRLAPRRWSAFLVFVACLGYMTASHLYRQYVDYMGWTLDFTGPQMLLTIKLTSLAYEYYDGVVDRKRIQQRIEDKTRDMIALEGRLARSIDHMPSVLEYYGYAFHYASFLVGPAFNMHEYLATVTRSAYAPTQGRMPPGRVGAALWSFFVGVLCMGAYVGLGTHFPPTALVGKEMQDTSLVAFVGYMWLSMLTTRFKYYFGWLVGEGACILAGFGFQGLDKESKRGLWGGVANMDVLGFELAPNVRAASRAWNKMTQSWLQHYVYERSVVSPLLSTYFISAFWHGFYPGYYLFFLSMPLQQNVNRMCFKYLHPLFLTGPFRKFHFAYTAAGILITSLLMNYMVSVFVLLSLERSWIVWSRMYFFGHVALVIALVLLKAMAPRLGSGRAAAGKKRA